MSEFEIKPDTPDFSTPGIESIPATTESISVDTTTAEPQPAPEPQSAASPLALDFQSTPELQSAPAPQPEIRPEPKFEYRRTSVSPTPAYAPASASPTFYNEIVRHEVKKKTSEKFKTAVAVALIISIVGGSFAGFTFGIGYPLARDYILRKLNDDSSQRAEFAFPVSNNGAETVASIKTGGDGFLSYSDLVERVEPSVVTITSVTKSSQQFFNFSVPNQSTGAGSGILFSETDVNYYISTNAHVIAGANEVSVSISGSKPIPAKLVGKNTNADLAVISISKTEVHAAGVKNITLAKFGDSDSMRVGDFVLAIGNALGEGNTATNGIISAKDKEIVSEGKTLSVLQTNAAINRGNSGGPLINMNGEVIGINTAKMSEMAAEAMGYAIPSNVAKAEIEKLMHETPRPMVGIMGQSLTEEMAKQYNLPQAGAIVMQVMKDSPAEKAGLQVNDIITGVDKSPVFSMEQLSETIGKYKIGDKVTLKVIRDGSKYLDITLELVEKTNSF